MEPYPKNNQINDYTCSICLEIFYETIETKCKHKFCSLCF